MTIVSHFGPVFKLTGLKSADWGSMINDGYKYLLRCPVLSFAPGVCIMLVVFGFMMVGDGLRDALAPDSEAHFKLNDNGELRIFIRRQSDDNVL